MTDIIEELTENLNTKLSLEERMRISCRKYYNNRLKTDEDFYTKEKQRVANYMKTRYANDEEYRERLLKQKMQSYYKMKAIKAEKKQLEIQNNPDYKPPKRGRPKKEVVKDKED